MDSCIRDRMPMTARSFFGRGFRDFVHPLSIYPPDTELREPILKVLAVDRLLQ